MQQAGPPPIRRHACSALIALLAAVGALGMPACARTPFRPDSAVLSLPWDPGTLDPHARDRLSEFGVLRNAYDTLVALDAEMGIRPSLATRWVNPGPLTWIFTLRSGVRFHDGRVLEAADVVYSIERVMGDRTLETGVYTVQVESVRARGPLEVELRTRRPHSVLLNKLSSVFIVPRGSTGEELAGKVVGTGPYRLESWEVGQRVELVRNDAYWGERPALRKVTILLARSPETAVREFLSRGCQLAQCTSRAGESALRAAPDARLIRRTGLFLKYLGFNRRELPEGQRNPFLDLRVRRAVSLAIDRRELVASLSTFAVPASQLVPPFVFGFNPSLPELRPDPGRARALLAETGFPGGIDLTLTTRTILAETAGLVREQLASVGIRARVEVMKDPEFFDGGPSRRHALYLNRLGCITGDASDVLDSGIHTVDPTRRFGTANMGRHSDPELDADIERSAEVLETHQRSDELRALMSKVMERMVWVPLYFDEDVYALRRPFTMRLRADSYVQAADIRVE